jgi:hypothetical protein
MLSLDGGEFCTQTYACQKYVSDLLSGSSSSKARLPFRLGSHHSS